VRRHRSDHVAKRPGLLVEAGAALDVELLGHVDLHIRDVVAIPDRLEDPVGKPRHQDVLGGLLAEEVVDPVDRLLLEHVVQGGVEPARRLDVVPEGLLHHQRAVIGNPGLAEHHRHVLHRAGRHRQVDEALALGTDLLLGVGDGLRQFAAVVGAGDDEAQPGGELVPVLVQLAPSMLFQRRVNPVTELLVGARRMTARADDPEVPRHQLLAVEVKETGEQLPCGEISGRPEDDEHSIGGTGQLALGHRVNLQVCARQAQT
jgi:hypothetical protein